MKVFARSHLKGEEPVIGGRENCIPTPQGRGGSVSRRDHNQAYRRCAHFQAELSKRKDATQAPTALRERGSGGEVLLSEKRPLPPRNSIALSLNAYKKPPLKGEVPASRAEGFRSPAPQGRGGSVSRRDHN